MKSGGQNEFTAITYRKKDASPSVSVTKRGNATRCVKVDIERPLGKDVHFSLKPSCFATCLKISQLQRVLSRACCLSLSPAPAPPGVMRPTRGCAEKGKIVRSSATKSEVVNSPYGSAQIDIFSHGKRPSVPDGPEGAGRGSKNGSRGTSAS